MFAVEREREPSDVDASLYDGFIGDGDKRLFAQVRTTPPEALGAREFGFRDARLPELLFRYRARNWPQTLTAERTRALERLPPPAAVRRQRPVRIRLRRASPPRSPHCAPRTPAMPASRRCSTSSMPGASGIARRPGASCDTMSTYFSDASFKFLRGLARNNDREWFQAHKADYDAHVREPFQRLLTDLQPVLAGVSEHYRSEPKGVGGSLFRIHRDTRFANDKTPYKTWQGARLFHERGRQVEAPSFYLHLQPGNCFVGAGPVASGAGHAAPRAPFHPRQSGQLEGGRARRGSSAAASTWTTARC